MIKYRPPYESSSSSFKITLLHCSISEGVLELYGRRWWLPEIYRRAPSLRDARLMPSYSQRVFGSALYSASALDLFSFRETPFVRMTSVIPERICLSDGWEKWASFRTSITKIDFLKSLLNNNRRKPSSLAAHQAQMGEGISSKNVIFRFGRVDTLQVKYESLLSEGMKSVNQPLYKFASLVQKWVFHPLLCTRV